MSTTDLREEKLYEMRQDERFEYRMRTDLDFLIATLPNFEKTRSILLQYQETLKHYGWEHNVSLSEILEIKC